MKTDYLKMVWRMVAFLAAFYPVSDADVVSGTPAENFLRAVLPQKSTAPEGIVYQVPDDKLEPGKLYHDASQDKSRMVTRKRVVGSLNQTSDQEAGQVTLGNLKYDVTFHYASSRESKGKGVLTWSVNRLDVNVDKTSIENQIKLISDALKAAEYETSAASQDAAAKDALYQKAVEYAIERTVAHENQHVMDATINPVWLYSISSSRDTTSDPLLSKSDREMINSLNPKLAKELDDQRLELIAMAEARAVFAEVRQATYQLEPLLDIDKENLPDAQKYVPALFGGIRKGIKQSEVAVKERMAEFTYDNVLDKLKSDRDLFNLAQQDVLDGSSAKIEIDKEKTQYSYEEAYNLYYNSALSSAGSAYNEYSDVSDFVGEEMEQRMGEYKQNIEKMYEQIHAKLYEEKIYLESIEDTSQLSSTDSSKKRKTEVEIDNFYEWLVYVEDTLEELPGDCAGATCKDVGEAAYFAMQCFKNAKKDDKASAMAYRVMGLRNMVTPAFVGGHLLDRELLVKSTEKKADVLENFAALISCNFNDNPLIEYLACVLVEDFPVGGRVYKTRKNYAIYMNNGEVPKSEDTSVKRQIYKWKHYRQDILNALKKDYMEQVDEFRGQAKRAAER